MALRAKNAGFCILCQRRYPEGTSIKSIEHDGKKAWVHESCTASNASSPSAPAEPTEPTVQIRQPEPTTNRPDAETLKLLEERVRLARGIYQEIHAIQVAAAKMIATLETMADHVMAVPF